MPIPFDTRRGGRVWAPLTADRGASSAYVPNPSPSQRITACTPVRTAARSMSASAAGCPPSPLPRKPACRLLRVPRVFGNAETIVPGSWAARPQGIPVVEGYRSGTSSRSPAGVKAMRTGEACDGVTVGVEAGKHHLLQPAKVRGASGRRLLYVAEPAVPCGGRARGGVPRIYEASVQSMCLQCRHRDYRAQRIAFRVEKDFEKQFRGAAPPSRAPPAFMLRFAAAGCGTLVICPTVPRSASDSPRA